MSVDVSPARAPIGNREQTPGPHGRDGAAPRPRQCAFSSWSVKSTESISPIQNALPATAIAAGEAGRPGEVQGNRNMYPDIPTEWVGRSANAPTPIALNGQFGQD
eukprot:3987235-Pyramimonas_sp.AAC.1